jgi:5-formyltetrahydrofolate cyclo-ligase
VTGPLPEASANKTEWRAWARTARCALDFPALSEATNAALLRWPRLLSAGKVLMFLPLANEIDLGPLLQSDLAGSFYATRTPDRGGRLTIHELSGPLEVHRLGFLQPHASAPEVQADELDVALVPGLAFDLYGARLGRGAGYYDELLPEAASSTTIVGVTPMALVLDRIPRESHDVAMGALATEEGVVPTAR